MATNEGAQKRYIIRYDAMLKNLRTTWAVCGGAMIAVVLAAFIMAPQWLAIFTFLMIVPVSMIKAYNLGHARMNCSLMTNYTVYSLAWSSAAMLFIIFLNRGWFGAQYANFAPARNPFVPALLLFTVTTICFGVALLRRGKTSYCKSCRERASYSMKDMQERGVFHHETKHILRAIFVMSLCVASLLWAYYFLFFINVNINSTDRFFFAGVPTLVYIVSVIALVVRHSGMSFKYTTVLAPQRSDFYTVVRFIVVRGNVTLLREMELDNDSLGIWDTPASMDIDFTEEISDEQATEYFKKISGTDAFTVKPLFTTSTDRHNVFHYAAFLNEEDTEAKELKGEWFNIIQVDMMLKTGMVARPFAYEIHRIYTMTMAWKTYNADGERKYAIKNYRPTFRLSDFKDWDLDYNDAKWLLIAENNEDRPFFKIRRFWRRHISGEDNRWKQSRL